MISQAHRFHGRNSLRFVYQRGQNIRGGQVSLRYIENPRRRGYRVAVVVSRKVSKSAVVRNRIRRRIYETVREHARQCTRPLDLVFTVYGDDVAAIPFAKLEDMVAAQLAKAGAVAPDTPDHAIVGAKEI
ncbi:MAG TPA: ribonuclease P protein component [Candidatus Saccharimonadales bacterium]|nr:ribonuclease P protein component [Candidatus Saccharimonadales bacterium]